MTVCEFCKSKYTDNNLEFCPGCGAKLKKIPDPPRRNPVAPPPVQKPDGGIPMVLRVTLVLFAVFILLGAFTVMNLKRPDTGFEPQNAVVDASGERDGQNGPSEAFSGEFMRKLASRIWNVEAVTKDMAARLTYLSLYTTDDTLHVGYGFGDPLAEDFTAEFFSEPYDRFDREEFELQSFTGLRKLETTISVAPSAITRMKGLKYLSCPYYAEDLSQIEGLIFLESLVISGSSLETLDGIENFPALKELSLERADITDLSPLSSCKSLVSLSLNRCEDIQNLNILGDFSNLTSLSILNTDSTDLNFIGRLKLLKRLTVSGSETKTLAFAGELPNLEYLCLSDNSEAKIMPSFERTSGSLKELVLSASGFDDVDFLYDLANLEKLTIYNPPSVQPLSKMTKLEELTISPGWGVDTLDPLGNLTSLKKLTFVQNMGFTPWNNNVFSFLSGLTRLEELSFAGCGLYFNADPVYSLANLKSLDYSGNTVCGNFSSIKNLARLEKLNLNKTRLASSFWIESDGFITSIGVNGEQTIDSQASSIAALSGLRSLDVSKTDLQDISFLGNLKNLEYFYASDNYITDVFVLSELPNLKSVDLSANAVTNWDALDSLKDSVQIVGKP